MERFVGAYLIVILLIQMDHTFAVEVSQPAIPQVGVSHGLHYQLWGATPVDKFQREGVEVACQLFERKGEVVRLQPCIADIEKRHDAAMCTLLDWEQVTGHNGSDLQCNYNKSVGHIPQACTIPKAKMYRYGVITTLNLNGFNTHLPTEQETVKCSKGEPA